MMLLIESVILCLLFTAMTRLATWRHRMAFTNDYPPVMTDKLRDMGLIAEKPPARRADVIRKAVAALVKLLQEGCEGRFAGNERGAAITAAPL